MNKVLLPLGLLITVSAAMLLIWNVVDPGIATVMGILGIGLIAASRQRERSKPESQPKPLQVLQTLHSPDRQLRALIKQRADGKYQIDVERFVHGYSQEFGPDNRWERQSTSLSSTLEDAVAIAASNVGAGTSDFFDEEI